MANEGLVIQSPVQGIGASAYTGFGNIQNLDFDTIPGVVRLNKKLSLATGTFTELPYWIVRNPKNSLEFFALGASGQVQTATNGSGLTWSILGGNTKTGASGNGLAICYDYLFVTRDASVDTFGPLTGVAVTVTAASPAVISSTGHGLGVSTPIIFSATTIPAGITAGTVYYVSDVNLLTDSFQIKDAIGGSQINTTTTGSGVKYRTWYAPDGDGVTYFKAITSDADWHPMLVSKLDGKLYGGSANQVFKLSQVSTFNPISSGTYSWSAGILTTALDTGYRIKCLAELGSVILAGTWKGTNVFDFPVADIFPIDQSGAVIGTLNPVILNDFGVHAMLAYGSTVIVLAGINGAIYQTDGVNFNQIAKLPIDVGSEWIIYNPGAICKYKGKVFFGVSGGSSGSNTISPMGTYSLKLTSSGNILNCEHTNSQDTTGSAEAVNIGSLLPITGHRILAGFVTGSTKGIDLTSGSYLYGTDYIARFDTPFFPVGSAKAKALFTELDFLLSKNLATGEGIQISYRLKDSDSFTVIGTYTYDIAGTTILGAVNSYFTKAGIIGCEQVQLRIGLKGTTSTTPSLKQVEIK